MGSGLWTYLSDSGLAGPSNGSRITASTRSSTLVAVLPSDLTQYRKSSRITGCGKGALFAEFHDGGSGSAFLLGGGVEAGDVGMLAQHLSDHAF